MSTTTAARRSARIRTRTSTAVPANDKSALQCTSSPTPTTVVEPTIDAAGVGVIDLTVAESKSTDADGRRKRRRVSLPAPAADSEGGDENESVDVKRAGAKTRSTGALKRKRLSLPALPSVAPAVSSTTSVEESTALPSKKRRRSSGLPAPASPTPPTLPETTNTKPNGKGTKASQSRKRVRAGDVKPEQMKEQEGVENIDSVKVVRKEREMKKAAPPKRSSMTLEPENLSARRATVKAANATSTSPGTTVTRSSARLRLRHANIDDGGQRRTWGDVTNMRGLGLGGDEDAMSELSDLSDLSDLSELTALSDLDMEFSLESVGGWDARETVFSTLPSKSAQVPIFRSMQVAQIARPTSTLLLPSASNSAYDPPHLPALKRLAAHATLPLILVSPPVETMRGSGSGSAATSTSNAKEGRHAWKEKPTQLIYAYPGVKTSNVTKAVESIFPLPTRATSVTSTSTVSSTRSSLQTASTTVPQLVLAHLTNARPLAEQIRLKQLLRSSDPAWASSTKGWKALERSVCAAWIEKRAEEVGREKERRDVFFRDGEQEGVVAGGENDSASPLSSPIPSPSEDLVNPPPSQSHEHERPPQTQDTSSSPPPPSSPESTTAPPQPQPLPLILATTIAYPRNEERHRFSPRAPSRLRIAHVVVPACRAHGGGDESDGGDTDVDVEMDDADADAVRSSDTIPIEDTSVAAEREDASAVRGSKLYRRIEKFIVGGAGGVISTFGPGPDADVSELSLDLQRDDGAAGDAGGDTQVCNAPGVECENLSRGGNEEEEGAGRLTTAPVCVPSSLSSFVSDSTSSEVEDGEKATGASFEREPTPVPSSPSASLAPSAAVEDQCSPTSPPQTPPQSPSVFPRQHPQPWHRRHADHRMEPPVWKWASLSRVESSCAIFGVDTIKAVIASEVEREAELKQGGAKRFVIPSSLRYSTSPTSPHSPSAASVPYFSYSPSESYPVTVRLEDAELDADAEGEYEYDFSAGGGGETGGDEWEGDEDAMCVSYSDEEDEDDDADADGASDADSEAECDSDEDEFLPTNDRWEDSKVQVDGEVPILEALNLEGNVLRKEGTFDIDQAVAKIQATKVSNSKASHSQDSASSPHHHGHRKSKMKGEGAFRLDLPEGVDRASLAEESAAKGAKEITFRASPPLSPTSPTSPSSSCSSSFSPTPSPSPTSAAFFAGESREYASDYECGFDHGYPHPHLFRWSHIPAPCLREPMHPIEGKGTPGKGRGWEDWASVARGEQLVFESRPPLSSHFSGTSSSSSGDNDADGIPNARGGSPSADIISQDGAVMQGDPSVPYTPPTSTHPMPHPQQQLIQIQIPQHPHQHQEQSHSQQHSQLDLSSGAYADIHLVDAFVEQVNSGNYTGQSDSSLGSGLSTLSGGQDAIYASASSPVGLDVPIVHSEMPMSGVSSPCGAESDAHQLPSSSSTSSSPSPSPASPSSPQMNAGPTQENMLYGLVGFNLGVGVGMTMGVNVGVGVGMGVGVGVGMGVGLGMGMGMNMNMNMGGMGMGNPSMSNMANMGVPMDMSMPMSMDSDFSFVPHNMGLGLTSPLSPLSPISPISPLGIATLDSVPISVVGHPANAVTATNGLFDAYDASGLQSHHVHSPHHSPALGTVEFGNVFGSESAGPVEDGVGVGLSTSASPELTPLAGHVEA